MNEKVPRTLIIGLILTVLFCSLMTVAILRGRPGLWMLEISEDTARAYNQLCVVDEKGHLYSLSGWVPAPKNRDRLIANGVKVSDYAILYEQKSYELLVSYVDIPIPVVTSDKNLIHYYFTDESVVSFRKASPAGLEGSHQTYSVDSSKEYVLNAKVGPEGYGVYDLSELEDGLYYVNSGGLVELKRSK